MDPDIKNDFSGIPSMSGFIYQIYYYLKVLLRINHDEAASMELYDDVALEYADKVKYVQLKHTTTTEKIKNLSDRDDDLWKTLYIWVKIIQRNSDSIEDQKDLMSKSRFVLMTNKKVKNNTLYKLINSYLENTDDEILWKAIDDYVYEQANKKKPEKKRNKTNENSDDISTTYSKDSNENGLNNQKDKKPQQVNIHAKVLYDFKFKKELLTSIEFITESDKDIFDEISKILQHEKHVPLNNVPPLRKMLLGQLCESFKDTIQKGKYSKYTGISFNEEYGNMIAQFMKRRFVPSAIEVVIPDNYKDLTFIRQLVDIQDNSVNSDRITDTVLQRLEFMNDYNLSKNNVSIDDQRNFVEEVHLNWENSFDQQCEEISPTSTEEEVKKCARKILYELRKSETDEPLNRRSVIGCYYHFSDGEHPTIGWRHDWKDKYNGKDFRKKWTID